jgi:hypothetical protein
MTKLKAVRPELVGKRAAFRGKLILIRIFVVTLSLRRCGVAWNKDFGFRLCRLAVRLRDEAANPTYEKF